MTKIEINEWLQDAIIDFLREWVRERVVPERHPEAENSHIATECYDASSSAVKIHWWFNPTPGDRHQKVAGDEWFTPRDALALFLQHGISEEGEVP